MCLFYRLSAFISLFITMPTVAGTPAIPGIQLATFVQHPVQEKLFTTKSISKSKEDWDELNTAYFQAYNHGDFIQAEKIAQNALELAQHLFGKTNPNTADSLTKLGVTHEALEDYSGALAFYKRSLEIFEHTLGENDEKVAMDLNNMANVYAAQKDYAQAETLHIRALHIRENKFGSDNAIVAQSAYNLAMLYDKQGKLEEAELFYKQATLLWEKNLGPSHPNVAMALGNLANIYAAQGKDSAAEELHLRALDIRETSFGPSSLAVAESLFNLGSICTKQGKYTEAEPFFREALDIMEQRLKPNDPQIALALYGLANIYHIKAKTESSYNQVLEDRIGKINEDNSPLPLEKSKNDIYQAQLAFRKEYIAGLYVKAEPLYQRAIKILEQAYGIQHPSLKIMKDELAMIHDEERDN